MGYKVHPSPYISHIMCVCFVMKNKNKNKNKNMQSDGIENVECVGYAGSDRLQEQLFVSYSLHV